MKIYSGQNVFDAALDRIRFIFDNFETVVVDFSGGKDSVVCLFMSLIVAREKKRLPLKVLWIDQEVEWQGTVDLCTKIMEMPEVEPYWFQMPMVITNNVSSAVRYNHCWNPEESHLWIHPLHPLSRKVNLYGTGRFHELFHNILQAEWPGKQVCQIAGVRCEESPARYTGLTNGVTFKGATWGKIDRKGYHYTMHPLYDWSYRDIWKAIFEYGWPYNRVYDGMYKLGVQPRNMRVSNLHHETAMRNLTLVQEIEPQTWQRITARITGSNTIKHLQGAAYDIPRNHPPMFKDWEEYALFLADRMIPDEKNRDGLLKCIEENQTDYPDKVIRDAFFKIVVKTIMRSDWDYTCLHNFISGPSTRDYRYYLKGEWDRHPTVLTSKYVPKAMKTRIKLLLAERDASIGKEEQCPARSSEKQ